MRRWTWELQHSISGRVEFYGWVSRPIVDRRARILADFGGGSFTGEGGVWTPPDTGYRVDALREQRPTR